MAKLTLHIDDEGVAGSPGVSEELEYAMTLRFDPVSVQLELWRHRTVGCILRFFRDLIGTVDVRRIGRRRHGSSA